MICLIVIILDLTVFHDVHFAVEMKPMERVMDLVECGRYHYKIAVIDTYFVELC